MIPVSIEWEMLWKMRRGVQKDSDKTRGRNGLGNGAGRNKQFMFYIPPLLSSRSPFPSKFFVLFNGIGLIYIFIHTSFSPS